MGRSGIAALVAMAAALAVAPSAHALAHGDVHGLARRRPDRDDVHLRRERLARRALPLGPRRRTAGYETDTGPVAAGDEVLHRRRHDRPSGCRSSTDADDSTADVHPADVTVLAPTEPRAAPGRRHAAGHQQRAHHAQGRSGSARSRRRSTATSAAKRGAEAHVDAQRGREPPDPHPALLHEEEVHAARDGEDAPHGRRRERARCRSAAGSSCASSSPAAIASSWTRPTCRTTSPTRSTCRS